MKLENIASHLNTLDDKSYITMLIAYNISPTIEGLKPSSLMVFRSDTDRNTFFIWDTYKEDIKNDLGIDYYELKKTEKSIHILFYNKAKLNSVLKDNKNISFLNRFGYLSDMNTLELLGLLKQRYENICPHEIGIFLGYPISDVIAFMECPNRKCAMTGYWKVYNDLERAKKTFESYDNAKAKIANHIYKKVVIGKKVLNYYYN